MKHRWAALGMVLVLSAFMPGIASAQGEQSPGRGSGGLKQNYPNPFNPQTKIPFEIGDPPTCTNPGKQHKVSLRIYNLLAQLVAIPVLQGGSGGVSGGQPLENVQLSCGSYTAYWDGTYRNSTKKVASGVYLYRLEIDGRVAPGNTRKMIVMK